MTTEAKRPKESFIRWLLAHHLDEGEWMVRALFTNTLTVAIINCYLYMMMTGIETPEHFEMLIGMIAGFYYRGRSGGAKVAKDPKNEE